MSSPYDVLGDPDEYKEWLASQQPPEPAVQRKRDVVAQQIQELPEDILQVVSQLDQQHSSVILSAYQQLQLRSCAGTAGEWRDKKELLGTLEAAIPYTERGAGGADIWPLQLRDNWTRHVPLGNMFSGLFMEISEKTQAEKAACEGFIQPLVQFHLHIAGPACAIRLAGQPVLLLTALFHWTTQAACCRQLVTICRPELLEPHLFPASAPGGLPISAAAGTAQRVRRRSWASSDYLAERLQHFSTYLKEVQPHQAEAVAVQGRTVQPACLSPHITLEDLVASLRLEQGEVAAALVKARDSLKEQASIQQQHEAKQAASAAALLAAEKAKPKA
ncbi:hypothetical protein ABBQ32_000033 [Trebouxia sp. C0010 RCD-2024]